MILKNLIFYANSKTRLSNKMQLNCFWLILSLKYVDIFKKQHKISGPCYSQHGLFQEIKCSHLCWVSVYSTFVKPNCWRIFFKHLHISLCKYVLDFYFALKSSLPSVNTNYFLEGVKERLVFTSIKYRFIFPGWERKG